MHLQPNANAIIQTRTTAGQLESLFLDAMLSNDLLLTPHRPFSHRVPTAQDVQRRVLLCILEHSSFMNCTAGFVRWGASAVTPLMHRVGRRRARWNPAPSCRTMRLDGAKRTAVAIEGCGTPVATAPPRTVSRVQSGEATDYEILLRPDVGEGRNRMLRRGCCASSVSESVHGRLGFSSLIEEQSEGHRHGGEELRVLRCPGTPCHVRKRAVLYAYGDVLVRSGEWPILVPFPFSEN